MSIHKSSFVCASAEISGKVYIGANTIVAPNVKILANGGRIEIGTNCVIETGVSIINDGETELVEIGDYCMLDIKSQIMGNIGSHTVLEPRCKVGKNSKIGEGVSMSPGVQIEDGKEIPNGVNVFVLGADFDAPIEMTKVPETEIEERRRSLEDYLEKLILYLRKTLPSKEN